MIFVTIIPIEIQNLLSCDNEISWNSHVGLPIFAYFDFYKSQLAVIHPVFLITTFTDMVKQMLLKHWLV